MSLNGQRHRKAGGQDGVAEDNPGVADGEAGQKHHRRGDVHSEDDNGGLGRPGGGAGSVAEE